MHPSPATIYRWRNCPALERTVVTQHRHKLAPDALRHPVRDYPDTRLKDRAKDFGVRPSAIGFALKRYGITVKKTEGAAAIVGKPFDPIVLVETILDLVEPRAQDTTES